MSGTVNTSEVAGFLTETQPPSPDAAVTDALTTTVVHCTQLDPTLVRPRWQPTPPTQPPVNVDWCGIGVIRHQPSDYPYLLHDPTGNDGKGQDYLVDYDNIEIVASFYGPNALDLASKLRRALNIGQNRDVLYAIGVKVTEIGQVQVVPDTVNLQIIDHVDLTMSMVREITTAYNIETLLSASGVILVDKPPSTTNWSVP